jgi:flagellar biosynthesis GTPase FlhF
MIRADLLALVDDDDDDDDDAYLDNQHQASETIVDKELMERFENAPIFTSAAAELIESSLLPPRKSHSEPIPQYGLIGIRQDITDTSAPPMNRLILTNTTIPWSAFICGSQGAGKSHTLCCLLENSLISSKVIGVLPYPLAGIVMHYDKYTNYSITQVCEAAYLCSSGIPVTVLVSPSNIWAMTRLYTNLPGLPHNMPRPKVLPLYLAEDQLNVARILKLMAFNAESKQVPLYMEVITSILRVMAMEGPAFSYSDFRQRLEKTKWVMGQSAPLNMRLQLLDSFLAPSELTTMTTRPACAEEDIWDFKPGTLTIIDLSDPFMGSDDACTLFSISLSIFLESRNKCGQIVALDEAHKFLTQTGEAQTLTEDLVSIMRQQRHTGTRVIIATQEPTLSPQLLDLANATFIHRFISPAWYTILKGHLAGAKKHDSDSKGDVFDDIVALRTGEALMFCPTAQVTVDDYYGYDDWDTCRRVKSLGYGYIRLKVRKRLTTDGGQSIKATESCVDASPQTTQDVPMYVVERKPTVTRVNTYPEKAPQISTAQARSDNNTTAFRAAPTSASPAQKAPAQKAPAQKAPAQKSPAQKSPAQKAPAQKSPAQKSPAQKSPAQKAPAQKAPAQKAPAQKAPAQKSPAQKAPAHTPAKNAPDPKIINPSSSVSTTPKPHDLERVIKTTVKKFLDENSQTISTTQVRTRVALAFGVTVAILQADPLRDLSKGLILKAIVSRHTRIKNI